MEHIKRQKELVSFLKAALECSVYLSPLDYGLTFQELMEIGSRAPQQFERGEISDMLSQSAGPVSVGKSRYAPQINPIWHDFSLPARPPDFRNVEAFDFVFSTLKAIARKEGTANARIDRSVLLARAIAAQLPALDVEVAITIFKLVDHINESGGVLQLARGRENWPSPKEQLQVTHKYNSGRAATPDGVRDLVYRLVKDIIGRRSDGRPLSVEPLKAFPEKLEKLGYSRLRMWWSQILAELEATQPTLSPVSQAVLCAALVEAALISVVKHSRALGIGLFGSTDFEDTTDSKAYRWKVDDLVKGASRGSEPILDQHVRQRAEDLIKIRQRIHAGRMLLDFERDIPDFRPEEARRAREIAEQVVRSIGDWLDRHPGPVIT